MNKELTKEQRGYIETILKTISAEVGGLDNIKFKYAFIEFTNDEAWDTFHVENLKKMLIRGEYGPIDSLYMNNRKETFERLVKGEPFTVKTERSV